MVSNGGRERDRLGAEEMAVGMVMMMNSKDTQEVVGLGSLII